MVSLPPSSKIDSLGRKINAFFLAFCRNIEIQRKQHSIWLLFKIAFHWKVAKITCHFWPSPGESSFLAQSLWSVPILLTSKAPSTRLNMFTEIHGSKLTYSYTILTMWSNLETSANAMEYKRLKQILKCKRVLISTKATLCQDVWGENRNILLG